MSRQRKILQIATAVDQENLNIYALCEEGRIWRKLLNCQWVEIDPLPPFEDVAATPAMESAGLNELVGRLGWIAAHLSDIGWGGDSATVAQASDLIRRQASPAPSVTHDPSNTAPLLWLLWNHLGSQSPVGQPIRECLGMGQFDHMTEEQVEAAKQYVECKTCQGLGTIDETLGGWSTDNPAATCPDCDGVGEARQFHRHADL